MLDSFSCYLIIAPCDLADNIHKQFYPKRIVRKWLLYASTEVVCLGKWFYSEI